MLAPDPGVVVVVVVVEDGPVPVVELSGVLMVVDVADAGGWGAALESVGLIVVGAAVEPMFCSVVGAGMVEAVSGEAGIG